MKNNVKRIGVFNLLGIALIIATAVVFVFALCVKNDFWVDEAMLVQTVFTRNFAEIASSPPDYSQNAPLGYLYILKLFSLVFGTSTTVVRIPAILAGFGIMFFAYRIAKDLLKSESPFLYAGVALLSDVLISYSTQAKQYSFEAFCVLICIWLIGLYWNGRIKTLWLSLWFAIIVWFSFTSLMFMFSGIIVIIVSSIIKIVKKEQTLSTSIFQLFPFTITLISVLANLILWLLPCSNSLGDLERAYWDKIAFPLIPTSLRDIKLLYLIARHMVSPLSVVGLAALLFAIAYFLIWADKYSAKFLLDRNMLGIYLSLATALVASYFKYLPMSGRIWVFIYPLIMIAIAFVAERIPELFANKQLKSFVIIMICLVCVTDFAYIVRNKQFIWNGQQMSASIEYMNKHKQADDYVYVAAIPQYCYLTGYQNFFDYALTEHNEVRGNVIYGSEIEDSIGVEPYEYGSTVLPENFNEDIQTIIQYDRVWLLFAHRIPNEKTNNAQWRLLETLKDYGNVTLENEFYGTPAYLFLKK